MSSTVDNRVVSMQFDNKDFEKNCSKSITTLEKLKQTLNLEKASESFIDLGKSASAVSFEALYSAGSMIGSKISAGTIIAITAITRLTNAAIDAGEKIVKSLSVDQVMAGWDKYALKTTSVQTIFNATKDPAKTAEENLAVVTGEIDKLNWFTDETSFNLVDMTSNIAKFTSAGIELPAATKAMMGIASAAGYSGVSIEKASHAMEGFAKSMAAGYMSRQNWSWIKTAGMDTLEFKQQMIDGAVALGKIEKKQRKVNGAMEDYYVVAGTKTEVTAANFEESLKDKWLTSDVMEKVLGEYGDFATKAYEVVDEINSIAGGDLITSDLNTLVSSYADNLANGAEAADAAFRQQAEAMGLSNEQIDALLPNVQELSKEEYKLSREAFAASQEAKTFEEAIDSIKDAASTKWMQIFEMVLGDYLQAKTIWTELANWGWDTFVGPIDNLVGVFKEWAELGGRDVIVDSLESLGDTLSSLLAPFSVITEELFPSWNMLVEGGSENTTALAKTLKDLTDKFNDFIKSIGFTEWGTDKDGNPVRMLEELTPAGIHVRDVLTGLIHAFRSFKNALKSIKDGFSYLIDSLEVSDEDIDNVINAIEGLGKVIEFFGDIIESAVKAIADSGIIEYLFNGALQQIGSIGETLTGSVEDSNAVENVYKTVKKICEDIVSLIQTIQPAFDALNDIFHYIKDVFEIIFNAVSDSEVIENVVGDIADFLARLGESVSEFVNNSSLINTLYDSVKLICDTISLLSDQVFNNINPETIVSIVSGIADVLGLVANIFTQLFAAVTDSGLVGIIISDIGKIVSFITGSISELTNNANNSETFYNLFRSIADTIVGIYKTVRDVVTTVWSVVSPIVTDLLNNIFSKLTGREINIQTITDFFNVISEVFSGFAETIESLDIGSSIESFINRFNGNFTSIVGIIVGIGSVFFLIKGVVRTISGVFGLITHLGSIFDSLTGIFRGFNKLVNGATRLINIGSILLLVYSLSVIVDAVAKLGSMSTKDLIQGGIGVAVAAMVLIGIVEYAKRIDKLKLKSINSFAKAALKISAGLLLFAVAVKIMANSLKSMTVGEFAGVLVLIAAFVALTIGLTAYAKKIGRVTGITAFAISAIAIAAAILVFSLAVGIMAMATKNMSVGQFLFIIVLLAAFIAVIAAMGLVAKSIGGVDLTILGVAAIEISTALIIFSIAIAAMAVVASLVDKNAFANVIAMLIMFVLVMLEMALVSIIARSANMAIVGVAAIAISAGLLVFAAAIGLMALATKNLSAGQMDTVMQFINKFMILILVMSAIALLCRSINMTAMGVAAIAIGVALIAFAASIAIISAVAKTMSGNALAIIILLLVMYTSMIVIMAGVASLVKGVKFTAFGLAAIQISAALIAFAVAIGMLAFVAKDLSADQVGSIALFLVAFVGVIVLLGLISKLCGGIKIASIGVGLLLASAAVVGLAASLYMLAQSDPEKLQGALGALVGAILALAVAIALLAIVGQFLSVGFAALSAVLFAIAAIFVAAGLAVALFGAGVLLTAVAIQMLGENSGAIVDVLYAVAAGLEALSSIGIGTVAVVIALGIAALLVGVAILYASVGLALITLILSLCASQLPLVTEGVVMFLNALASLTEQAAPLLEMAGVLLAVGLAGIVFGAAMVICGIGALLLGTGVLIAAVGLEKLGNALTVVAEGLEVMSSAATSLAEVGFGKLIEAFSGLAIGLGEIKGPINKLYDKIGGMGEGMSGIADAAIAISAIDGDFGNKAEIAGEGLLTFTKSYKEAADILNSSGVNSEEFAAAVRTVMEAFSSAKEGISDLTGSEELATQAAAVTDLFSGAGGSGLMSGFSDAFADLDITSLIDIDSLTSSFNGIGGDSGAGFMQGLTDSISVDSLNGEGGAFDANSIMANLGVSADDYQIAGLESGGSYAEGLNLSTGSVDIASLGLSQSGIASINPEDYRVAGQDAGEGFAAGLESKKGRAASAGTLIGNAALEAAKKALDINSPSRKFAILGNYSGEGFANGLANTSRMVEIAGMELADNALDSVSNAIQTVSDALNSDFSDDITIRPVVDMSEIRSGAAEMRNLLGWSPTNTYHMAMSATNSDSDYAASADNQNGTPGGNGTTVNITVTQPTQAWTEYLFNKFNVRFAGVI